MSSHPRTFRYFRHPIKLRRVSTGALSALLLLSACATVSEPEGPARKEMVYAVTASNQLISFNAGQPQKLLSQKRLNGLQDKETVLGIDYRVARGKLYAVGSSGRLYLVNTGTGAMQQVGTTPFAAPLSGTEFGIDFNPTVDRIRVVSNTGLNTRLHPDTGAVVDSDPRAPGLQLDGRLSYAASDISAGKTPAIAAAGYTYNKEDEKITTNFAIDAAQGTLVTQGSREGKQPAVSPNTGQLFTVGSLGAGSIERASLDIADVSGKAFGALTKAGANTSRWYEIDLASGRATLIGSIGGGEPVVGVAVEP